MPTWESGPAKAHTPVTPSDTVAIQRKGVDTPFRGLYVGTGGTVAVKDVDGTVVPYKNVPNGGKIEIVGTHVMATGTATADDIVAWF